MELKIPLKGFCPRQSGDTWLVTLGRMRPARKGQPADWATRYMLDGASPTDQERFRPMPFGARFLPNGDFSVHDAWKPKEAFGWYTGTDVVLPEWGGGQFPGTFHQLIDRGPPAVSGRTRPFRMEHFDTYITEADIARIKGWGFDHIRLGFDQLVLEEEPGKYRERTFGRIDDFIGWCGRHKLNVVLNLHKAIGNYCDIKETRDVTDLCEENGIPHCCWNYLSTPYDGNRLSLVDDDTREFLSKDLLDACLGKRVSGQSKCNLSQSECD